MLQSAHATNPNAERRSHRHGRRAHPHVSNVPAPHKASHRGHHHHQRATPNVDGTAPPVDSSRTPRPSSASCVVQKQRRTPHAAYTLAKPRAERPSLRVASTSRDGHDKTVATVQQKVALFGVHRALGHATRRATARVTRRAPRHVTHQKRGCPLGAAPSRGPVHPPRKRVGHTAFHPLAALPLLRALCGLTAASNWPPGSGSRQFLRAGVHRGPKHPRAQKQTPQPQTRRPVKRHGTPAKATHHRRPKKQRRGSGRVGRARVATCQKQATAKATATAKTVRPSRPFHGRRRVKVRPPHHRCVGARIGARNLDTPAPRPKVRGWPHRSNSNSNSTAALARGPKQRCPYICGHLRGHPIKSGYREHAFASCRLR